GGAAGATGPGCGRRRGLRGPGRGGRGPLEGCRGAVTRSVRYEGRGHLSFAIVRRALGTSLALLIGAVGAVVGQFAPPGTGGVARRFRPHIIVSVFSGTSRDGHGQHQMAGLVARQVFEALRDSSWGPVKLYRSLYSDTASATLRLDAGVLDPVEGRSYHQIAM